MRSKVSAQFDKLITAILVVAVFLTPLLLTNLTTEFYETPKLAFLLIIVCVLLVLRSLSWVLQGKVLITRTPVDIPLLLFLGIMIISSLYAGNVAALRYVAFFGNFPRIHGSTISWAIYILFFFLATAHLKSKGQVRAVIY